jgi:hypothetical protein
MQRIASAPAERVLIGKPRGDLKMDSYDRNDEV